MTLGELLNVFEPQFTLCENENEYLDELIKRVNEIMCKSSLAHSTHAVILESGGHELFY